MKLLQFMLHACKGMALLTGITALLSGVCNAGLIALVNDVIQDPARASKGAAGLFALLLAGKLFTNVFSQIWLIRFTQAAIARMRISLVSKILSSPLRRLEETGAAKLQVALTDDINQISTALFSFPILAVNLAILIGGSFYLAWLSPVVLGVMALFIGCAAIMYRLVVRSGFKSLQAVRESEDRLFGHFRSLLEGMKELKLNKQRRHVFLHEHLRGSTEEYQKHTVQAEIRFIFTHSWAHMLFFVLIGLLLFILPQISSVSLKAMTGYILTTLYLMGPLAGVMANLPLLGRANVSLNKIEGLGLSLSDDNLEERLSEGEVVRPVEWNQLELRDLTHTYYHRDEENHFTLGPINLTFGRGEVVFLVGGNGSGKSTFAKILTGLYPPEQGEILLDGKAVTDESRDQYRQIFSTVFSDYYLFESLLGIHHPHLDERARDYLEKLRLSHKVKVKDGAFSTTALSSGQRKRLALLTSYLEDRSFYLFDEWASDQDPIFKDFFYTNILPELKSRGKTVLVITHDDKYFHLADSLIKLDYGKIVEMEQVTPEPLEPLFAGGKR